MIDATALPIPFVLAHKPRQRTLAERRDLRVTTVHVTDPGGRGGFRVVAYQIAAARALIKRCPQLAGMDPADVALLRRLVGTPYHDLASPRLGHVRLHPVTLRTSHGDRGNMGGGWAADCRPDEPLTATLRDVGIDSLVSHVRECRRVRLEAGGDPALVHVVVPHRAWDYPGRADDPGAIVWRGIVLPALDVLGPEVAVAGYNTRAGSGKPIPRSWDDAALFDDRGIKL